VKRIRVALLRPFGAAGVHMLVMGIAYGVLAASMLGQGGRWHRTPAYHNLLLLMPVSAWGAAFGVTAVLLALAAWKPDPQWLSYLALTVALMLTTSWDLAFLVRWLTNSATTPETWVSLALFDYILIRAAALIDRERNAGALAAVRPEAADGR